MKLNASTRQSRKEVRKIMADNPAVESWMDGSSVQSRSRLAFAWKLSNN
jgi:hypothetical protein